jgi:hypothetical protein
MAIENLKKQLILLPIQKKIEFWLHIDSIKKRVLCICRFLLFLLYLPMYHDDSLSRSVGRLLEPRTDNPPPWEVIRAVLGTHKPNSWNVDTASSGERRVPNFLEFQITSLYKTASLLLVHLWQLSVL